MTTLEEIIEKRLNDECQPATAKRFMSNFNLCKLNLVNDIYKWIPAHEPDLTDHSGTHIEDVLERALKLLPEDSSEPPKHQTTNKILATHLNAIELYLLGMGIIFHDAGNIFGRIGHGLRTIELYNNIMGTTNANPRERTLIHRVVRAHTGKATDDTNDTLREVAESDNFDGHPVRLRSIAAILRFADELAEGRQRTSQFLISRGIIKDASMPFHQHSRATEIYIDRPNGRICISHHYDATKNSDNESNEDLCERLRRQLIIAYRRSEKLDQERRYAAYYSPLLSTFNTTSIEFNFTSQGNELNLGLSPIVLDNRVIPGDAHRGIEERHPNHDPNILLPKIISEIEKSKQTNSI